MILHKRTLMCTKYEVNRCTHVEVIGIFVGGIFLGSPCTIIMITISFNDTINGNNNNVDDYYAAADNYDHNYDDEMILLNHKY